MSSQVNVLLENVLELHKCVISVVAISFPVRYLLMRRELPSQPSTYRDKMWVWLLGVVWAVCCGSVSYVCKSMPMLWEFLKYGLSSCDRHGISSDIMIVFI